MRRELRWLAVVSAVGAAVLACGLGALATWLLLQQGTDRLAASNGALPAWAVVLVAVLVLGLVTGGAVVAARALADRQSERMLEPMRQLAQRADEFGSGGFVVEALADLGAGAQAPAAASGIAEIDTVSRILDRNHRSMVRALSAERNFAADASHQLRSPLTSMLMRLEEIHAARTLGEARHEAGVAITQAERLADVVDDLLHRTRAGHADGGRSVSLDTVLNELQAEWEPAFREQHRAVTVTVERGMIVRSSASAIAQILNALMENALTHGAGEVSVRAQRSGPSAVIELRDQGAGIPPELARRVFDRAVTGGKGTGLGLAVARETAESFGGRLELVQGRPVVFALYVSMAPAR